MAFCPSAQVLLVILPQLPPLALDLLARLELSIQDGGEQIRRKVARAERDPAIFVDLTAEEAAAFLALLADDLRLLAVCEVVDEQRPAFAEGELLGLVEALGCQPAADATAPSFALPE